VGFERVSTSLFLWALYSVCARSTGGDEYILASTAYTTHLFPFPSSDVQDLCEERGFDSKQPTLACSNFQGEKAVQVTRTEVRLINLNEMDGMHILSMWRNPGSEKITVASANMSQVAVAFKGGRIVVLTLDQHSQWRIYGYVYSHC
jgi:hypothetical protein